MDSRQNLNIELNQIQNTDTFVSKSSTNQINQNPNQLSEQNNNSQITHTVQETRQVIQNDNCTKTITNIEEKECHVNSFPFKSLIPKQEQIISSSNQANYKMFNNYNYNPFSKDKKDSNLNQNINTTSIISNYNQQAANTSNNNSNNFVSHKKVEKYDNYFNRQKSQDVRKTINVLNQNYQDTFKIELFRSQAKSRQSINNFHNLLNDNSDNIINEENINYKLLIKRIASQLKKKRKPPKKGYFYMAMITTDKTYIKNIKNIGNKMKIVVRQPTHGFFYNFIKKEKQYKLLVKKIASQLKRRKKLPTCKIIKVYESYRLLIKRIADQLKKSRAKRMSSGIAKTTTITTYIEKRNINNSKDNIFLNNKQVYNNTGNNMMGINYENNIINNNLIGNENMTKEEVIKSTLKEYIKSNEKKQEKIEIEEENHSNTTNINQGSNQRIESVKKLSEQNIENSNFIPNINDSSYAISNNAVKIIKDGRYVKSYPNISKPEKNIKFNISLFKKENNLKLSDEKNIGNRSHKKDINSLNILKNTFNNNNTFEFDNDVNHEDLNSSQDLNVSLSNIEATKSNFIHDFNRFLKKVNIEIVNNFPVSLDEKNKLYFQQSNFWLLILNYLFYQNNNISLYTIISILEQYNIWCTDKSQDNFNAIKERIKEYINSSYSPEIIKKFLFMNQFKTIDDIFEKYEIAIKNNDRNYREIKIDDINLNITNTNNECNCDLCINDDACIKKVADINKNRILISDSINMDFICNNKNTGTNYQNDITNKEELFYKGKSQKKSNIFSKSKTILNKATNTEYNIIANKVNTVQTDEILDIDDSKNFRNISKKKEKKKEKEVKEETINESSQDDKNIKDNNKDEKEEKEESEEENKNKKKDKKRKKSKSRNRKKRDSDNSDKNDIENVDEKKEEEKSRSKKKKKDKKRNKSYEREENGEKSESDEAIKDENKEDKNGCDCNDNNSKRKKSRTPNKKKNKKH